MALKILFVIHLFAIGIKCIESVPVEEEILNEPTDSRILYEYVEDDYIEVLHSKNFNTNIYNSTKAWTVLFYNSQNYQWMDFYFTWKYLAESISNWRHIVVTGAVDCAGVHNAKLCQQYKISGYPTFRYYPPQLRGFNIGDTISTNITEDTRKTRFNYLQDMEVLRIGIVKCLENTETKMSFWPGFIPVNSKNVYSALSVSNDSVLILIVESDKSYVGRQLMMDFSSVKNVIVRYSFESWIADKTRKFPQAFSLVPQKSFNFTGGLGVPINPISIITDASRFLVFKIVQYDLKKLGFIVPDLIVDNLEPHLTDSNMKVYIAERAYNTNKEVTFLDSKRFTF